MSTFIGYPRAPTTETYPLSLHDALPIWLWFGEFSSGRRLDAAVVLGRLGLLRLDPYRVHLDRPFVRSEEHTSELQPQSKLVCRLLLDKKNEGLAMTMFSFGVFG